MIYALQTPLILLGMLLGYVLAGGLRAVVAAQLTQRGPGARLAAPPWQTWLDPYGAVGALISGVGWVGVGDRYRPGRWLVVDLVIHSLLAAAGFAGLAGVLGSRQVLSLIDLTSILHGDQAPVSADGKLLAGFAAINLACAILALVPIPPLAMGTLLWSRLPKSPQSRRIAYHLLEEHWGIAIVLVLLILPLAGGSSLLLSLIDTLGNDLLHAVG